jgi:SAM-dependent methyltransferase
MDGVRAALERLGRSRSRLARSVYRAIKSAGSFRRFVMSPRIRSQVMTRRRYKEQHFQGETFSCADRYPELFAECRTRLQGGRSPRILSYGCATGEEVFTLARYLPAAEIVGVDINPWCLKECGRRNASERIRFWHSLSAEFAEAAGFDAIFAMAVFQRTEHRTDGAEPTHTGFTFGRFDAAMEVLDAKLKSGGLMFLDECDFSFAETGIAPRYEALEFEGNRAMRDRPLFGRDDRRISSVHASPRTFRKLAER